MSHVLNVRSLRLNLARAVGEKLQALQDSGITELRIQPFQVTYLYPDASGAMYTDTCTGACICKRHDGVQTLTLCGEDDIIFFPGDLDVETLAHVLDVLEQGLFK